MYIVYFQKVLVMTGSSSVLPFKIEQNQNPVSDAAREELLKNPGFGRVFTDHMAVVHWTEGKGWHDAVITARKPFEIDPASAVLHYGQEVFEGLKAYRAKDGRILLFRPEANAQRFQKSARRLAMPELPEDVFLAAINELVRIDQKWIPSTPDASMYLRPFMFANEAFLGVHPAREYVFCIIASPVGAYFKGGATKPVSVWLDTEFSRAGPGGTGEAKCGGNYASSLIAQIKAEKNGCDQVLFLDVVENKWIEELGGMNVCFVMDDNRLITPKLDGTILHGVTRRSILKLAEEHGMKTEERSYSFEELKADAKSGHLKEVFACGTAAVITPIGVFKYEGGETVIGNGNGGETTLALRDELVHIQKGDLEDKNGWVKTVKLD